VGAKEIFVEKGGRERQGEEREDKFHGSISNRNFYKSEIEGAI